MRSLAILIALMGLLGSARAQAVDPRIAAEIARIKAIDHHAHPMKVVLPGEKEDTEYDALPADAMEPFEVPARIQPDNPPFVQAWRELYGYPYRDASPAHVKRAAALKAAAVKRLGAGYANWVLDKLGIDVMFANRVALGKGLAPPRFRWVPFDDALLLPLNNGALKRKNPEYAKMYAGEEKLLARYLGELLPHKVAGLGGSLPPTLAEYVSRVVKPTLARQKRGGAVAIKFEASYLRTLEFADTPQAQAEAAYAQYVGQGEPPAADYKALQDYLFRVIAAEAGRLGMAVHFHTGQGVGAYFNLPGANPAQLESVFDSPALRKTSFVLIHGGWPYVGEAAALLGKPNVYLDYSLQTLFFPPSQVAKHLRQYLSLYPGKVMFGTDSFMMTPEVNWEETGWLSSHTAREALGIALTQMVREGEIPLPRALQIARQVLRGTAAKLYKLDPGR